MKNTITEIINSVKGLISKIEGTEKQITELEDGMIDITQSEQRENRKMNRIARTYGTITKRLIFVSLNSWKKKEAKAEKYWKK